MAHSIVDAVQKALTSIHLSKPSLITPTPSVPATKKRACVAISESSSASRLLYIYILITDSFSPPLLQSFESVPETRPPLKVVNMSPHHARRQIKSPPSAVSSARSRHSSPRHGSVLAHWRCSSSSELQGQVIDGQATSHTQEVDKKQLMKAYYIPCTVK